MYYQGAPQPLLTPTTLASVLAAPKNGLGAMDLQKMRDDGLNELNALVKASGNTAQKNFVDQYAADGFLIKQWTIRGQKPNALESQTVSVEGLADTITDVFVRVRLSEQKPRARTPRRCLRDRSRGQTSPVRPSRRLLNFASTILTVTRESALRSRSGARRA